MGHHGKYGGEGSRNNGVHHGNGHCLPISNGRYRELGTSVEGKEAKEQNEATQSSKLKGLSKTHLDEKC